MADAQSTVPQQWDEFRQLGLQDARGRRAFGAYAAMSEDGFEYLTGVEVDSFDDVAPELGRMRVPEQEYAVFRHEGSAREVGRTWQYIWRDWLPSSGYVDAETPPFELFGSDFDPDTGSGGFEIWFPIRRP